VTPCTRSRQTSSAPNTRISCSPRARRPTRVRI
jgi:hypothetical protein